MFKNKIPTYTNKLLASKTERMSQHYFDNVHSEIKNNTVNSKKKI